MNYDRQNLSFVQKTTCLNEFWLWNFKFGHLHYDEPQIITTKKWLKLCFQSKNHLVQVSNASQQNSTETISLKVSYRENTPLELIHTVLCGPMQTELLKRN
jgi:hypothetical protein